MKKIDLEINWVMNDCCNFKCVYCYPDARLNQYIGTRDIKKVIDGFDRTDLTCLIYLGGGEPFLFPNFVDLCKQLTQKHVISINSNLAHKDVYQFADGIDPEQVRCVHASFHVAERERLRLMDDFVKKYHYLQDKGFYVYASYVLYPSLLKRFQKDYVNFKARGIVLRPKVFRGSYRRFPFLDLRNFRRLRLLLEPEYPRAYSPRERAKIALFINKSQDDGKFDIDHTGDEDRGRLSDLHYDLSFVDRFPSFKGKQCLAGKKFVRMTPTGDVYRCFNDNTYLGNLFTDEVKLFEKVRKCTADCCSCPYIGYGYVVKDDVVSKEKVLVNN